MLANDVVSDNGGSGFFLNGTGAPTVTGSTFDNNNGSGMNVSAGCGACGNTVVLRSDTMDGNRSGGFSESGNGDPLVITDSVFADNLGGVGLYAVNRFVLDGNDIHGTVNQPGVMIYVNGPATVTNNSIVDNDNPNGESAPAGGIYAQFQGTGEVMSGNVIG